MSLHRRGKGILEGGTAMEWKKIVAIIREKYRDSD